MYSLYSDGKPVVADDDDSKLYFCYLNKLVNEFKNQENNHKFLKKYINLRLTFESHRVCDHAQNDTKRSYILLLIK